MMENKEQCWEFRLISLYNRVTCYRLNEMLEGFMNDGVGKGGLKESAVVYVCKKGNKT